MFRIGERIRARWYRLSWDLRASVVVLSLAGLAVAGIFTVFLVRPSATANVSTFTEAVPYQDYLAQTVTVKRTVTIKGKAVVKRVPVVRQVFRPPVTVKQTRTFVRPGSVRVVTRPVVRTRRVVTRKVVTMNGKPVTVNLVKTTTQVQTQLATVTNQQTIVQNHTATSTRTQTATVAQTATLTQTETGPTTTLTTTVTGPTETVTVTGPTQTETVTVTVTTTGP